MISQKKLIKPHKLSKGDTIGIISPSGAVRNDEYWESAINYFNKNGYKVRLSLHAKDKTGYLAGTDKNRLNDLISFFEDDEIKAIICSRGGYGAYRILPDINYEIIRNNPKIFLGYSDITALNLAFIKKSNLLTFHGPLALSDFGMNKINEYTASSFFNVLEGKLPIPYTYNNPLSYECIKPGNVDGELICGNLAIIAGLLGSPYFPDLTGKILLLEDTGEPLYKIDRMLTQLKIAGILNKISGLIFGEFTSIVQSDNPDVNKLTPIDIIREVLPPVDIPVGYGFPASHGECKATLPLGVKYNFDSTNIRLTLLEEYLK